MQIVIIGAGKVGYSLARMLSSDVSAAFDPNFASVYEAKNSCYLGHGGNFVHSRGILDKLLKEVPEFNIKLDPVGIMRNMKDDPYEIMKRYANRIAHFHAKDIFRYGDDGWEIEPIVGMGQLKWNVMLGMLWNVGYDGYIIIEPHGDVWAEPENRWKHIVLAKRHLEQYMIR